jgi:D-serine deaminase-like pyridoxal phosphate-dependent protein
VSQPRGNRLTLDAGHKAIAADPPAGERLILPALPSATVVLHSEEHVVLHTEQAGDFAPGEPLLAIPTHVCPTCALHREVVVLAHNRVVETWNVASRDRV